MLVQQARTVLLDRNNNNFLHPQRTHKQLSCLVQVDLLVRRDPHPRVRVVHTQWPRLTSNSSSTTSSLLRRTHSSHPWRHSSSLEVPVCSVRWLPPLLVSLLDLPSATVCLTCSSVAAALHPPNRLSSRLKRTTRVPTPDSSRRWALAASSKARISSSVLKAVRFPPPPLHTLLHLSNQHRTWNTDKTSSIFPLFYSNSKRHELLLVLPRAAQSLPGCRSSLLSPVPSHVIPLSSLFEHHF